jgi:hypothetical protein
VTALDALASERRWVAWRNELRGSKLTKVPYAPNGKRAKADDPSTWGTCQEAEARAKRIINGLGGGIGIELGDLNADLYLAGLDLDSCLEEGAVAPWAAAILAAADTYAEISPSGGGVKLFFYIATEDARWFLDRIGIEAEQWGCRRDVPGADARDHGPAVEVYLALRYFAVTGDRWPSSPNSLRLLDRTALDHLAPQIPPPKPTGTGNRGGDNSRSAIAFRKGAALRREGKTFEEMCEALRTDLKTSTWYTEKGIANGGRELRRIWDKAGAAEPQSGVRLEDFYAFMPMHNYIYAPTLAAWPATSVNARIPPIKFTDEAGEPVLDTDGKPVMLAASAWLDRFRPVEQMSWAPGLPTTIRDKLILKGGWVDRPGVTCLNLYQPPTIEPGNPANADRWIEHVRAIYPTDADHILDWLAHRVQRPQEKINHALVLGGEQGIGKDTLLEPVKHAIGPWNFQEASPVQVLGRFNGFLLAVILRISEARDLGEFDRFKFYDHMKAYTASPPDTLRVDEKHLREYAIPNCCGVVITTNHKTDGIFLPADDRRHYIAWSDLTKDDGRFQNGYWTDLHAYYRNGGMRDVTAFLTRRDISKFDAKAPPPKTAAFWAIVDANRAPEEPELADVLDQLGNPAAVTLGRIQNSADGDFADWLKDRKNRRVIPHRLERCGYVPVRNPDAADGLWKIAGKRQAIYAKSTLLPRERIAAVGEILRR